MYTELVIDIYFKVFITYVEYLCQLNAIIFKLLFIV